MVAKKTSHNIQLGKWGEAKAADFLRSRGYELLKSNVRTPYGEIDLVALEGSSPEERVVVFIEVKTRASAAFGLPEESITRLKQEHLINSALHYIQEHPDLGNDWRIDVISLQRAGKKKVEIVHFQNAVETPE
jgi:putative endonuclease